MSASEFEWVDLEDADAAPKPPAVTAYIEQQDDEQYLVAHEDLNPYGWIASTETWEVRR